MNQTAAFIKIYLWVALLIVPGISWSQATFKTAGSLDTTFNSGDIGYGFGVGSNGVIFSTAIQNDGKIIVGGSLTFYNNRSVRSVARLNTDGKLDSSFNTGSGANLPVYGIGIQSDEKILICGSFSIIDGVSIQKIARLDVDGSLDTTFNIGSGANYIIRCLAIQQDNKIVIGGEFTAFNGILINRIARLNQDGSLDTTFQPGSGANSTIHSLAIQDDEKIIIGGEFSAYNGVVKRNLIRINPDGSMDTTFRNGTTNGPSNTVYTTKVLGDGKIIIGGAFTSYDLIPKLRLARLHPDGTLDTTFNQTGGANGDVLCVSLQSDGKIIVSGKFYSYNGTSFFHIVRVDSLGVTDPGFIPISGTGNQIYSTSIQNDGKIIIGGQFFILNGITRNNLTRLLFDGTLDYNFNPGTGANEDVICTTIQSDGKIIVGGDFTIYNSLSQMRIARLLSDGSNDVNFNVGSGANASIRSIAIQNDGKIIFGGSLTSYNGVSKSRLARINSDGTIDPSFNTGTGVDGFYVNSIAIQSDGKIIIGGSFDYYNGISRPNIARLNTDGSLDLSFNIGTGTGSNVQIVRIQNDGKIIIAGTFSTYNGLNCNNIIRINPNGTMDNSFNAGTTGFNSYISSTLLQDDQKILIGGGFGIVNGIVRNRIARLNTDGSLDFTFDPGIGIVGQHVLAISMLSNGKIIIGGEFSSYNGTPIKNLARLESDGSLDIGFDPGTGPDEPIFTTAIQNDGKVIIGGHFISYDGIGRNRIARVLNCSIDTSLTVLQPTIIANATNVSYQWVDCNNNFSPIPNETSQSFTALTNGNYAVIFTENGCSQMSSCVNINQVGVIEKIDQHFNIYPNPCSGKFYIDSQSEFDIQIFDVAGKLISNQQILKGKNSVMLDKINNSLYSIILTDDESNRYIKRIAVIY